MVLWLQNGLVFSCSVLCPDFVRHLKPEQLSSTLKTHNSDVLGLKSELLNTSFTTSIYKVSPKMSNLDSSIGSAFVLSSRSAVQIRAGEKRLKMFFVGF